MATTVNIHEAKTNLSKLIARATNGEDIVIAKAGKPVVRLTQIDARPKNRKLGILDGLHDVPEDIDTPFEAEVERLFYGNPAKLKR
jgi:prevent-host-death family protein